MKKRHNFNCKILPSKVGAVKKTSNGGGYILVQVLVEEYTGSETFDPVKKESKNFKPKAAGLKTLECFVGTRQIAAIFFESLSEAEDFEIMELFGSSCKANMEIHNGSAYFSIFSTLVVDKVDGDFSDL